jgi:hypothetical protein
MYTIGWVLYQLEIAPKGDFSPSSSEGSGAAARKQAFPLENVTRGLENPEEGTAGGGAAGSGGDSENMSRKTGRSEKKTTPP